MQHDPQKYLHDILECCEFLSGFAAGKSVSNYQSDRAFRSVIERQLQIIGEAVMQLDRIAPDLASRVPQYREIIAFRHVLVHGYHSLDPQTVWGVVEHKLSILKVEISKLMRELGPPET